MRFRPLQSNKRWFRAAVTLLLSLFLIFLLWIDYIHFKWRQDINRETETEQDLALLHSQMRFIAMDYEKKEAELMRLRGEFNSANGKTSNVEQDEFYKVITDELDKLSGGLPYKKPVQWPQPLEAELTISTMRHLLNYPFARCPAFQVLSPRRMIDVDLVIGIPTVKRDKENYLLETVQSLVDGMTEIERTRTLIIVCIGDVENIQFIAETAFNLNKQFQKYYGELIEVISPNTNWYPKWATIRASLGDSYKRTLWRTKQNLDAIFLMSYAQHKGTYYLMLEDDVLAKRGYVTEIMKFVADRTIADANWFFINFSTVGGIGKLFRTQDLAIFNSYVQVFYRYMPIDWLTESYLGGRICGINIQTKTLRAGKLVSLFYPHANPPLANVSSSVKFISPHTIERAYEGKDFFYGEAPKINDSIVFWYNPPIWLEKFYFGTGHVKRLTDILQGAVVEVLPVGETTFVRAEKFDEFGICERNVDSFGLLNAIRIRILANKRHRIIINEIKVQPKEPTAQSVYSNYLDKMRDKTTS